MVFADKNQTHARTIKIEGMEKHLKYKSERSFKVEWVLESLCKIERVQEQIKSNEARLFKIKEQKII